MAQLKRIDATKIEMSSNSNDDEEVQDSVTIDLFKLNSQDTLTICATIKDCGEYGGHTEMIKVFLNKKVLLAQHSSEPLCNLAFLGSKEKTAKSKFARNGKYTLNKAVKLDNVKLELIQDYIIQFNNFKRNGTAFSNAPNDFWINFNNKTLAKRHDKIGNWDGFIVLRDRLYE